MRRYREVDVASLRGAGRPRSAEASSRSTSAPKSLGKPYPEASLIGSPLPPAFDLGRATPASLEDIAGVLEPRLQRALREPRGPAYPTAIARTDQDPRILLRNYSLFELNLFPTMRGRRVAMTGGNSPQKVAASAVDEAGAAPWIAVLGVEATSARDSSPRIATCVASFPGGRSTVRAGDKVIPALPLTGLRQIYGGQSTAVQTRDGQRVVGAFEVRNLAGAEVTRVLWLVEVGPDGATSISQIPSLAGTEPQATGNSPAIAPIEGAPDTLFVAWACRVGPQAAIATAILRRVPLGSGLAATPGWVLTRGTAVRWPVYPSFDSTANGFSPNLAAQYDADRGEVVLAAVKNGAMPFLARYDGNARLIGPPQHIGLCNEGTHGTVELRMHPVTGRLLLQFQHNWFYFDRTVTGGFQTLDNLGLPVDFDVSSLPSGDAPCNTVFPFQGRTTIDSIGEESTIGIGAVPGSEFAVCGQVRPAGFGALAESLLPSYDVTEVLGVWHGIQAAQQLLRIGTSQVVVSQALQEFGSSFTDRKFPPTVTTNAVVLGVVR